MQYRIRPFLFGVKEGGNLDSAVFKPTHSIISRTSVLQASSELNPSSGPYVSEFYYSDFYLGNQQILSVACTDSFSDYPCQKEHELHSGSTSRLATLQQTCWPGEVNLCGLPSDIGIVNVLRMCF